MGSAGRWATNRVGVASRVRDWTRKGMGLMNRRGFHSRALAAVLGSGGLAGGAPGQDLGAGAGLFGEAPGVMLAERDRPAVVDGVASGDVGSDGIGVVWARADRPSLLVVEWSTVDSFRDARRVVGAMATPATGLTAQAILDGLPAGQTIVYRAGFVDPFNPRARGRPVAGRFRTPPDVPGRDVRFAWGGDVAGQGFGIDASRGGLGIFEAIRRAGPDFFLHSGDHVYADNPVLAELPLRDGTVWRNLVTEGTSKVAETIEEFRSRFRYNRLDEAVRDFGAEVPVLAQWDDHETLNNWYPGEILDDSRYAVKDVDLLAGRARQAFFEHLPLRAITANPRRIYRSVCQGPDLEVFLLDQRTHRGANSANRQPESSPATAFLGPEQLRWLLDGLRRSRATWKVVASDMPLGLVVADGPNQYEALANGDPGGPLGRELELARLLGDLKAARVRNVVWLTADVHYAAAHHYDPERARFADFDPFWEFVAGPLHAGGFGPGTLDPTFGPEVRFHSIPAGSPQNQAPATGTQFFGQVAVSGRTQTMTVSLHNRTGAEIYKVDLPPERA